MMRIALLAAFAASLAACATNDWPQMRADFAEVAPNCGLHGVDLERDARDRRLLHLIFGHRNNMAQQARDDGRVACMEHWAHERGYRLTTAGANGPRN